MRKILERLAKGEISVDEAELSLKLSAIEEISDIAKVDIGREFRKGIPEIILAIGKLPEETVKIALHVTNKKGRAIVSRA
ncbi:MAG: hypothetical protein L6N95_03720, partial [Candidatus Methylarchaceae archaeon HK01B]|nr:hypothetical protein [Candidatus Methylarchaceae archaeon HK01B]